ncbi:MAG TPA: DUF1631 family protein [Solimonas sp.]|nr:DUF1631 family protein [Solimonas sp.]
MTAPSTRDGKAPAAAPAASAPATPRGGEPQAEGLVRAIEQFVTTVLGEQLSSMLDGADDILFEMAEKAPTNSEQRLYFDTLRIIRLERPRLMRTFADNLKQTLADGRLERATAGIDVEDLDSWSIQGVDEAEENVAVSNLESKVATLYQQELFELENRLETLSESTHDSVSPALASPKRIFDAFRYTMRGLDVEFPVKLVIYKLAEKSLIGNLKQVYTGANQMLSARGFEPRRTSRPATRQPVSGPGPAQGQPQPREDDYMPGVADTLPRHDGPPDRDVGMAAAINTPQMPYLQPTGPGAWPAGLSASRLLAGLAPMSGMPGPGLPRQAMPAHGMQPQGMPMQGMPMMQGMPLQGMPAQGMPLQGVPPQAMPVYSDSQLAGEMATALDSMARGRPVSNWMPAPNLALAGRMFDSLYQDKHLPDTCRPLLQRLQYPVMKTALADPSFFNTPSHPVRKLVHEVFDMLVGSDPGPDEVKRLSDMIENLLSSVEVDAAALSTPAARAPAVTDTEAEAFLADQEARMAGHRQRTVERVRRLVAQELQMRTAARYLPDSLRPLLLSGFAPLLAVNVLQGGMNGIPWQESLKLLDRVLDSLDPAQQATPERRRAVENQIAADVYIRLTDVGLAPEKVERLITTLAQTYRLLAQQPQAPIAPAPAAPAPARIEAPIAPLASAPPGAAAEPEPAESEPAPRMLVMPPPAPAPTPQSLAQAARPSPEVRAKASAQQALTAILTVGSWFQVWDSGHQQQRWLKLHAYFPAQDIILFDDFLGENHLRIRASTFTHDLIAKRSAPVDPNPAVQRSLDMLAPLADTMPQPEPPVWQASAPQEGATVH